MKNNSKFVKANISFGQWIYQFFLLQYLPIFYTLKGLVLFGIFPSIASSFYIFYKWIATGEYDLSLSKEFKKFYEKYFWETNKLGWGMLIIGAILLFDLYISSYFIQSIILHTLLVALFFVYLVVGSYLFFIFARYDFEKTRDYIKQTFFVGLTSIIPSIAILVAVIVISYIFYHIPFLFLFFGLPILIGSISWFAYQGVSRAENMHKKVV